MLQTRVRQFLKPYRDPALRPYFNPLRDWTRTGLRLLSLPHSTERFVSNLRRLNDVIAGTALDGHYWLTGGLLLGWAREGRVLAWDIWDADFCFRDEHRREFFQAADVLERAGFHFFQRLHNNAGIVTQYRFERGGAWFEFFETRPCGEHFENFMYGKWNGDWYEFLCQFPAFGLEPIKFLDKVWFKPDDHDTDLTSAYGNWRMPQEHFDFATESPSVVRRTLWVPAIGSHGISTPIGNL